jgi:hypothetical protein
MRKRKTMAKFETSNKHLLFWIIRPEHLQHAQDDTFSAPLVDGLKGWLDAYALT